ncbi:MAG: hypothetical protein UZ22_OP11002000948 [Microgenomates bacterium OLB23]|nr:MAG: hypothetical protein UZ22_OP11002000948 [Microgenomates bacterium OLB23]
MSILSHWFGRKNKAVAIQKNSIAMRALGVTTAHGGIQLYYRDGTTGALMNIESRDGIAFHDPEPVKIFPPEHGDLIEQIRFYAHDAIHSCAVQTTCSGAMVPIGN